MKKILVIVLAVVLALSLLLTGITFAGGGEREVVPAQIVIDASLSEVSTVFDTPKANLEVARSREFNFRDDKFLLSSIVDIKSKQTYMVSTDAQGKVWIAEPKIECELIDYMSQMKPDETVLVSIWAIYVSPEEELRQIPSKYPDVPFTGYYPAVGADASPEVLDSIEADITEIKLRANEESVQPVVDFLQSTGSKILYVDNYAPIVDAELSKYDIYKLARLPEVKRISLPNEPEPCMDSAARTIRADMVWDEDYDGGLSNGLPYIYPFYQTQVAVLDEGVDFNHSAIEHAISAQRLPPPPSTDHGTMCAGCIASIDETNRGIAYGTRILDANFAGTGSTWVRLMSACEWARDWDADVYSLSWRWATNGEWDNDQCEYFDNIASEWRRLPVVAAGNDGEQGSYLFVGSPANAFNVLAVGGIDDKNTGDWNDDEFWLSESEGSSWKNPEDGREKPEVCAPADNLALPCPVPPGGGDCWTMYSAGTSFACPQVAGIAALMIEKDPSLRFYPELTKAIIMASAIHDVVPNVYPEDPEDPPSYFQPIDMYEGVGTVDAYAAYECVSNNWMWSDNKTIDDPYDGFEIEFDAEAGETVRFVLNWLAHTTYEGRDTYGLYTDLGLEIVSPYNTLCGYSLSEVNPWEIVQFTADYNGTYRALVYPQRYTEGGSDEYIAAAWYRWFPEATTLELLPETDSNPAYTTHNLKATVYDQFGWEMEGVDVTWSISGVGFFSGTPESPTDADGEADAVITSSVPGTSTVRCEVTSDASIYDTATKDWTYTPAATTLELLPEADSNPVYTTHNLMATVYDQFGYEMEGVAVTWSISGVGSFSGTPEGVTDADGQADAVITSSLPGTSTVRCEVTSNASIYDTATKDWTYFEGFEWGSDGASLATSGGVVDWEVSTPGSSKAEIDTAQKVGGTRSARIYRQGSNSVYARHWQFQPDRISFYLRKDYSSCADIINGDGAHRIVVRIPLALWYPTKMQYYDGTYHDTGYTIYPNYWYFIELRNIDWEAATYDIYVNGQFVKYRAAMHTSSENSGYIYFGSWAGWNNFWIDDITG